MKTASDFRIGLILICFIIVSCGPQPIFLKPGIDTPAHHIQNGRAFLKCGKIDAAQKEFTRAKQMNPELSAAYVGLALVFGHKGMKKRSYAAMKTADALAGTPEEKMRVKKGYARLNAILAGKRP